MLYQRTTVCQLWDRRVMMWLTVIHQWWQPNVCQHRCMKTVMWLTVTYQWWLVSFHFSFSYIHYSFWFLHHYLELKVDCDISTHVAVRFSENLSDLEIEVLPHSKGSKANNAMCQTCTSTYREIESGACVWPALRYISYIFMCRQAYMCLNCIVSMFYLISWRYCCWSTSSWSTSSCS